MYIYRNITIGQFIDIETKTVSGVWEGEGVRNIHKSG